jgi:high-affinity nickel permease
MDISFLLLVNAFILGFRHGIDWDHLAAIFDIVGTLSPRGFQLSMLYALGHALVVLILGAAALSFKAILPGWIDGIMGRMVGITLIFLSAWVFVSLVHLIVLKREIKLQSRWMLVLGIVDKARKWILSKLGYAEALEQEVPRAYGNGTAFGVGMIHGFGAETGTQMILLASVSGASSNAVASALLIAFVVGLLISNGCVGLLAASGMQKSSQFKSAYIVLSAGTAVFSLVIGALFLFGKCGT